LKVTLPPGVPPPLARLTCATSVTLSPYVEALPGEVETTATVVAALATVRLPLTNVKL
jgi:hypothetical protein